MKPFPAPDEAGARSLLIAFINAGHGLTHYALLILPTAALVMARPDSPFGQDYGPVLALGTGMFVFYALGSLPQGWLAERFGRVRLMQVFFLGAGLSLVAAGLCGSPLSFALWLTLAGIFISIYHPVGTAMLVEAAGLRPGRSIGVNGVSGNLGVALAPVVTALLAQIGGWRPAFIVPGLACLALGLLWPRVRLGASLSSHGPAGFPQIPRRVVRQVVVVLLLTALVSGLVFNAYTLLLPKLMQERLARDPVLLPLVGTLTFAVTLCGAVAQFTFGRMIDRMTLRRIFVPTTLVMVPGLAALSFLDGLMILPVAAAVAAMVFGQVVISETMTARYIAPALRVKMYSLRFFVGFVGSAISPPMIGLLHQRTGDLRAVTLILAAAAFITVLCALLFPSRREELDPALWEGSASGPSDIGEAADTPASR